MDTIAINGKEIEGMFLGVHTHEIADTATGESVTLHQASIRLGPGLIGTLRLDAAAAGKLHAVGPAIAGRRVKLEGVMSLRPRMRSKDGVTEPVTGKRGDVFYSVSTHSGELFSGTPAKPVSIKFLPADTARASTPAVAVEGI